jgi:hypothetical protein
MPVGRRGRGVIYEIPREPFEEWLRRQPKSRKPQRPRVQLACAVCGCEVERPPSELAKNSSERVYCPDHRCYDDPAWRQGVSSGHARRWAGVRDRLLAESGGCGSPTCRDPECDNKPGHCHAPDCTREATIAKTTYARFRWVRGRPTLCCSSPRCAVLVQDENPTERWRREFEAFKERERRIDLREAADRLKTLGVRRKPATLAWEVRRLPIGKQFRGFGSRDGAWTLDEYEFAVLHRHLSESPKCAWHNDPELRPRWYARRFDSQAEYGRFAKPRGGARQDGGSSQSGGAVRRTDRRARGHGQE